LRVYTFDANETGAATAAAASSSATTTGDHTQRAPNSSNNCCWLCCNSSRVDCHQWRQSNLTCWRRPASPVSMNCHPNVCLLKIYTRGVGCRRVFAPARSIRSIGATATHRSLAPTGGGVWLARCMSLLFPSLPLQPRLVKNDFAFVAIVVWCHSSLSRRHLIVCQAQQHITQTTRHANDRILSPPKEHDAADCNETLLALV
jgi:hypothetical protein